MHAELGLLGCVVPLHHCSAQICSWVSTQIPVLLGDWVSTQISVLLDDSFPVFHLSNQVLIRILWLIRILCSLSGSQLCNQVSTQIPVAACPFTSALHARAAPDLWSVRGLHAAGVVRIWRGSWC